MIKGLLHIGHSGGLGGGGGGGWGGGGGCTNNPPPKFCDIHVTKVVLLLFIFVYVEESEVQNASKRPHYCNNLPPIQPQIYIYIFLPLGHIRS